MSNVPLNSELNVAADVLPADGASSLESGPLVYSRVVPPYRLPWGNRLLAFAIAAGTLAVLVTAALLTPSPDGTGTHQGLGLQACQFKARTGLPCPSCGFTTSFSYYARGNIAASLYIQPMGTVLACLATVCVWVGFYTAFTGRPVYRLFRFIHSRYYLLPLLGFGVLAWAWKIFLTLRHLDGWN